MGLLILSAIIIGVATIVAIAVFLAMLLEGDEDASMLGGFAFIMIMSWILVHSTHEQSFMAVAEQGKAVVAIRNSKGEVIDYEIVDGSKIINKTKNLKDEKVIVIDSIAVIECKCHECTKRRQRVK